MTTPRPPCAILRRILNEISEVVFAKLSLERREQLGFKHLGPLRTRKPGGLIVSRPSSVWPLYFAVERVDCRNSEAAKCSDVLMTRMEKKLEPS